MKGPANQEIENPFPGLRPFHEDEAHLFFGRESQVDTMIDKLARTRFLAVIGTSGSGKSSLVNCGLRPSLHRGLMAAVGTSWRMAQFRPGSNPLRAMARELAREGVLFRGDISPDVPLADILEATLRMSKRGVADICGQAQTGGRFSLLVVVDQFEELFRYRRIAGGGNSAQDCLAFINLLLEARAQSEFPIYIVLTMRSDFLGDCAQFPGLAEAINEGQYLVPRMTRDERRAAIAGPVGVGRGEITAVLLTRLVNDVGDNPDQLSILQHALNRTWVRWRQESRHEGPLSLPHYEAVGTMANALDQHAEKAYGELTRRQCEICEKIFKALTDKGTDARGIRRPTSLAALCALSGASQAEVTGVIDVFRKPSRSFLMPPLGETLDPETVVDISHESLMRVWNRLKTWADEEAQSAQLYRRLSETAALYEAGKAGLWGDPELQLTLDWLEHEKPSEAWAGLYHGGFAAAIRFLESSRAQRDEALREKEQRQKRELEQARALAEERARAARRLKVGFVVAMLLASLAAGAAGWALIQRRRAAEFQKSAERNASLAEAAASTAKAEKATAEGEKTRAETERGRAEQQALLADSRRLAAQTRTFMGDRIGLALLLGVQATRLAPTAEAQTGLIAALRQPAEMVLSGHEKAVEAVAFSPDGARLASISWDGRIILWDAKTGKRLQTLREHRDWDAVAFSPNGALLAAGGVYKDVFLWDARTGKVLRTLEGYQTSVKSLAFSPDSTSLAAAGDTKAMVWDLKTGKPLHPSDDGLPVYSVAFSPDGSRFASGTLGEAVIWDAKTGKPLQHVEGGLGESGNVAFSPDGKHLAFVTEKKVVLWDLQAGTAVRSFEGHRDTVFSIAISPDGTLLASGSRDNNVKLWDLKTGDLLQTYEGHQFFVKTVAFSPDGRTLASAGDDQNVILWNTKAPQPPGTLEGNRAAFSPDGKLLALASLNHGVTIRDAKTGKSLNALHTKDQWTVQSLAFSLDGSRLALGGQDQAELWDPRSGKQLLTLKGHKFGGVIVAFSPDGTQLASAGEDQTVLLWDTRNGQRIYTLGGHMEKVESVAFSPDGALLAAGSQWMITLWDVKSGKALRTFEGKQRFVHCLIFSPDGKRLFSGGTDTDIAVFDPATGRFLGRLEGSGSRLKSIAFSPDGLRFATGGEEKKIVLGDTATGVVLKILDGHEERVNTVSFSADGKQLASASADDKVILWDDIDLPSWQKRACRIANRNLTPKEWTEFIGQNIPYARTCPEYQPGN